MRKHNYYFRKYLIIPYKILRIAVIDTVRQDGIEHAGYLSFLSILSLFPFLIFLIAIIGFFGASEAGVSAVNSVLSFFPNEISQALAPRINEIILGPPQSFLTIAIIGVIWTASSSVEGCRTILNRAYRIAFPPPYLWRRFLSILQFFLITFSALIGIVVFVIVPTFLKKLELKFNIHFDINSNIFYFRYFAICLLLLCATSLLYYILPNAHQKITQTLPGSILTVLLWSLLVKIFIAYLHNFHQFNLVYGSLAGIIISLMFFYLVSIIFIIGAEFNYHFHRTYQVFLKKK